MRGLVWFREDLRTHDNTALYHAAKQCDEGIAALYIIDENMWIAHDTAACKIEFILRGLKLLQSDLDKLNITLYVLSVKSTASIPQEIHKLISIIQADALFFNRQYEINESRRDQSVEKHLSQYDISTYAYHDQIILPPGSVKTLQNTNYSVFTPYKRAWHTVFSQSDIKILPPPRIQDKLNLTNESKVPDTLLKFKSDIDPTLWPAGQLHAKKVLQKFISDKLFHYDKDRDFPSIEGTSKLSPYLCTGMISARYCFLKALESNHNELDTGNKGATTWMGELIWRDFYKHILFNEPRVSMHQAYKTETDNINWNHDETLFSAWKSGQTGYPMIDAAMRQLNTTGWMHNRLRMVVAMFFTKNLFLDWRLGEKYFMSRLIDGDLAANNGGWQWSASTGTDSAPYFRIFNPIRQSERFDPDGEFIIQYCPELKMLTKKNIHDPSRHGEIKMNYPKPIIELNKNRDKVLTAFKTCNIRKL
ncbi:MAG: deoxyribodipyrimidine photo-lyase [Gammaproteobacteria bacterium]|nr:deoxyribodipyrimidine photo-lyase [Gammaproteobacteria bacterium]